MNSTAYTLYVVDTLQQFVTATQPIPTSYLNTTTNLTIQLKYDDSKLVFNIKPFLPACDTLELAMYKGNNSVAAEKLINSSRGCLPSFYWFNQQFKLVLGETVTIAGSGFRVVLKIELINGSLRINNIRPAQILEPAAVGPVNAAQIDVMSLLQKYGIKGVDACPDFLLTVKVQDTTVFNDQTNGQCFVPIQWTGGVNVGDTMKFAGAAPGYKAFDVQTKLDAAAVSGLQTGATRFKIDATNAVAPTNVVLIAVLVSVLGALVIAGIVAGVLISAKKRRMNAMNGNMVMMPPN